MKEWWKRLSYRQRIAWKCLALVVGVGLFVCLLLTTGEVIRVLTEEELEHLELAGVVHDIGIRPAEEKFGKHDGPIQEREGVEPARQLLQGIGVEEAAADIPRLVR